MHVVHVITDLGTGGAEMMLLKVVRATKHQIRHSVISLHSTGDMGASIKAEGVPVYALGIPRGSVSIGGIARLIRILSNIKPDVVQGWMYHANLAVAIAKAALYAAWPMSWTIRFSIENMREKRLSRIVIRMCALLSGAADAIIYNSERSREQHERAGYSAKHGFCIPNGFELDRLKADPTARAEMRRAFGVGKEQKLVGQLCRLSSMKDLPNFVRAASIVSKARGNTVFVLAGGGIPGLTSQHPELEPEVEELGPRLRLLPVQSDVVPLLCALDVAVLSSAWGEGFPNVLGEAMACGVPCVATDVGDSRTIVDDSGIVVPPSNGEALANAITRILELDDEQYRDLSARARSRVVANYSIEVIAERYRSVWTELVNGTPAARQASEIIMSDGSKKV